MPIDDDNLPQTFTLEGREIFAVGVHNGDRYTSEDLDEIADNFNQLADLIKPPLKLGHNGKQEKEILRDGQPALGWVENVRRMGEKLVADFVQVPAVVYAAIMSGRYKRISPEIMGKVKNRDRTFTNVLWAVSLLGADVPAVKNLLDIDKSVNALFAADTKGGLSFSALRGYTLEVDESTIITENKQKEGNMPELEEAQAEAKKYRDKSDADSTRADTAEAKIKEYEAKEKVRLEDEEKVGRTATVADVKAYCEEQVKAGKMLPVTRDAIVVAIEDGKRSYSHADRAVFVPFEIVKGYVESVEKIFVKEDEEGTGEKKKYDDVATEVHDRTMKLSVERKIEYGDALTAVLREDSELADRYKEEM